MWSPSGRPETYTPKSSAITSVEFQFVQLRYMKNKAASYVNRPRKKFTLQQIASQKNNETKKTSDKNNTDKQLITEFTTQKFNENAKNKIKPNCVVWPAPSSKFMKLTRGPKS